MQACHCPASIASRNALEPLALVRSPTIRTLASWANGTWWYRLATPGSGLRARGAGVRPWIAAGPSALSARGGAPERLQRGQRGADLAAEQHRPGGLDGDMADQRDGTAGLGHRALRADHRGLRL